MLFAGVSFTTQCLASCWRELFCARMKASSRKRRECSWNDARRWRDSGRITSSYFYLPLQPFGPAMIRRSPSQYVSQCVSLTDSLADKKRVKGRRRSHFYMVPQTRLLCLLCDAARAFAYCALHGPEICRVAASPFTGGGGCCFRDTKLSICNLVSLQNY